MPDVIPDGLIWIKADGAQKFQALSRRLRKAGRGDLQRELTRAIRREGAPALAAVRAAWLTVEVSSSAGGKRRPDTSTGLRRRVSRATRMAVQARGIKIYVQGNRVDPRYPSLPFYLNGFPRGRPWRHPVFGNRNVWSAQRGSEVFYPTLRLFARDWRNGIEAAMNDVARQIEG